MIITIEKWKTADEVIKLTQELKEYAKSYSSWQTSADLVARASFIQDHLRRLSLEEFFKGAELGFWSGQRLEEDALRRLYDENSVSYAELIPKIFRDGCLTLLGYANDPGSHISHVNT